MCVEPLKMRDNFTESLKSRAHVFFRLWEQNKQPDLTNIYAYIHWSIKVKTVKTNNNLFFFKFYSFSQMHSGDDISGLFLREWTLRMISSYLWVYTQPAVVIAEKWQGERLAVSGEVWLTFSWISGWSFSKRKSICRSPLAPTQAGNK